MTSPGWIVETALKESGGEERGEELEKEGRVEESILLLMLVLCEFAICEERREKRIRNEGESPLYT